jgi:hypothetical protein
MDSVGAADCAWAALASVTRPIERKEAGVSFMTKSPILDRGFRLSLKTGVG